MKCVACNEEAFFSITVHQNKNPGQEGIVYYFCGECYTKYQEKNAN